MAFQTTTDKDAFYSEVQNRATKGIEAAEQNILTAFKETSPLLLQQPRLTPHRGR
jgi:hypothetical protein